MAIEAGTFVTPTVRLEHQLGEGGMGSVWLAQHTTLHTKVVVKFIANAIANDADSVARFSREAAAAAAVKSPHVVQVHDHGIAPDGTPFIVMELLEGKDLGKYLEERGVLPIAEVDAIVSQVCKALARAHDAGVVHRDIKPQNLFLCEMGDGDVFVKLLDFGIAKKGDTLSTTKTGASVGTPFYMSPEQVLGEKTVGPRSDLWSVGVVAFEALTGQRPFLGETMGALALAICQGPLPVPSQIRPGLDRALDPWFAKACARDPAARFGSARELSDVLHLALARTEMGLAKTIDSQRPPPMPAQAALSAGGTTAAPVSGGRPPAGSPRGVAVALVLGVAAVGVLVFMRSGQTTPSSAAPPTSTTATVSATVSATASVTAEPSTATAPLLSSTPALEAPDAPTASGAAPVRVKPAAPPPHWARSATPSSSSSARPLNDLPPIE
jgi:eukaryotic-like serine/threonine-protein kinase